jgi:hypothetical protein
MNELKLFITDLGNRQLNLKGTFLKNFLELVVQVKLLMLIQAFGLETRE